MWKKYSVGRLGGRSSVVMGLPSYHSKLAFLLHQVSGEKNTKPIIEHTSKYLLKFLVQSHNLLSC